MLRSLARLWVGVLLLAVALAPAADGAAGHSAVVELGDLMLILVAGALVGYALRRTFGRAPVDPLPGRRGLLLLVVLMVLAAPLLPLTFAQQVIMLGAGGLVGLVAAHPRPGGRPRPDPSACH
ncbi:MAG TPA: hypothetical protein VNM16_12945 [Bacillota bacterium]|nr:hypothetical protein [Bacillota bacterium]